MEAAVTSWLVCSSPERAVRIETLARDIEMCSQARNFTLGWYRFGCLLVGILAKISIFVFLFHC